MSRQSLTDHKLKSLKPDRKREDKLGHFDTWDTDVHGLGVRTSKTGRPHVHPDGSVSGQQ
ncbi:MAG TPA: hypothetical protein VKE53_10540 [Pseudolabrys sp.]|nr:hypothetical protein [Pseudolabrys sp.]